MNKKRLLSLVLSFALVFTTVFAGAGSVFAGEKTEVPIVSSEVLKSENSSLRTKLATAEEDEPLNVKTMLYSNYSSPEYYGWDIGANSYVLTSVTPKNTGMMYLDIRSDGDIATDVATVYWIESCEMTEEGLSYNYYPGYYEWDVSPGETLTTELPIPVTKGKKYQFLIVPNANNSGVIGVEARAKVYTTGARTISSASSSKYAIASGINQDGDKATTWFKVKPSKTGVMTVTLKSYGYSSSYGKVKLYSSEKNARSETVTYSSSGLKVKFGVKKGRTYYLKVTDCNVTDTKNYKYGIRYTISAATDRSIGTKSKAKRIYRKADSATKSLFVAANANSADWYKFTVKTARKTKITLKTSNITSGYVIMRLYKSNGKLIKTLELPERSPGGYIYTTGNLAKGTYYVKVTKSTMASGSYTVRWTY